MLGSTATRLLPRWRWPFAKGDFCKVDGVTDRGVVIVKDGRRSTLSYRYTDRIAVSKESKLEIARCDRLQLKFNGKSVEGLPLVNGELVTVHRVRKDGAIVVGDAAGNRKTLAPSQRLFNRGYAVTSYASQGKTVDTVLLADAASPAATNRNQWYVAISRGRLRALVFTSDKDELRANIQRAGERRLALEVRSSPASAVEATHKPTREMPRWMRHAWATIQRAHRRECVEEIRARVQQDARLHEVQRIRPQQTAGMRIRL